MYESWCGATKFRTPLKSKCPNTPLASHICSKNVLPFRYEYVGRVDIKDNVKFNTLFFKTRLKYA